MAIDGSEVMSDNNWISTSLEVTWRFRQLRSVHRALDMSIQKVILGWNDGFHRCNHKI